MEKIFESNEMPEDLAGDNYKFVYEYLEYQNMPLNIFTQSFFWSKSISPWQLC